MADDKDLFLKIVGVLERGGVLNDIVLIGSWVLPIYRAYFNNAPEIPVLRTTDVDFLVGMPPRIRREFDVPAALSRLGFEPEWSSQGGYCKYVHPEMEVEFLIPEQGRGADRSISVDALHVEAQPLRFLSLAYDRSMIVRYQGYDIRVPDPEAFVFLKLLVIPRRKDQSNKVDPENWTTHEDCVGMGIGGFAPWDDGEQHGTRRPSSRLRWRPTKLTAA